MQIKNIGFLAIAVLTVLVLVTPTAHSQTEPQTEHFFATLSGSKEVPPINTDGTGQFDMTVSGGTITFTLTFSGLSSSLTLAHLHFAPTNVAGGVMIFLCGGGGQPDCPATTEGTITGTITTDNVTGPATQGIDLGDLGSALAAVRNRLSYVNMHTTNFGTGEIRGQVSRSPRGTTE